MGGQYRLGVGQRQADRLQSVSALVEVQDCVFADHIVVVTNDPELDLEAHACPKGCHCGSARLSARGTPLVPFRFRNRGNTAIVGRHSAVFDFGRRQLKGTLAWLLWAIVHVYLLVGFEKRVLVTTQWLWRYMTYERGARLITMDAPPLPVPAKDAQQSRPANPVLPPHPVRTAAGGRSRS